MSAQTILHPTIGSLKKESQNQFIENAKKLLLKENFALGSGYCMDNQLDALLTNDILSLNNCNISIKIHGKIHETEDSCEKINLYEESNEYINVPRTNKRKSTQEDTLYKLWINKGNKGSLEDFLDTILKDDEVEWEGNIKW